MYTLSTVFTFVSKIIKIEIIIVKGNIKIVGFTKNNGIETKYFGNDNEEI